MADKLAEGRECAVPAVQAGWAGVWVGKAQPEAAQPGAVQTGEAQSGAAQPGCAQLIDTRDDLRVVDTSVRYPVHQNWSS